MDNTPSIAAKLRQNLNKHAILSLLDFFQNQVFRFFCKACERPEAQFTCHLHK